MCVCVCVCVCVCARVYVFVYAFAYAVIRVEGGRQYHYYVSMKKKKKYCTHTEICKQTFLEVTAQHQNYVRIFTHDPNVHEKVAAAAVSSVAPNSPFSCRLRDHCSIYTAELQAVLITIKQACQTQESEFTIFSDSLPLLCKRWNH